MAAVVVGNVQRSGKREWVFLREAEGEKPLEPLRPFELGLAALVRPVVEGVEEDWMPAQLARIPCLRDPLPDAALRIVPAARGHLVVPDGRPQEVPTAAEVPLVSDDLSAAVLVHLAAVERRGEVWELRHTEPRGSVGLLQPAVIVDPKAGEGLGVPRIQRVAHADPCGAERITVGHQAARDFEETSVVFDPPLQVHVRGVRQLGYDRVPVKAVVRKERTEERIVGIESARLAGIGHQGLLDAYDGQAIVQRDSRRVQAGVRIQLDARAEAHDHPIILDDREVAEECLAVRTPPREVASRVCRAIS